MTAPALLELLRLLEEVGIAACRPRCRSCAMLRDTCLPRETIAI